ncbi:tetratricopeptide repeat protein [Saccharothrix longispora]|uniref:Tetratricopeptide repeat protein n=1 Tax=Saccharothrix longispora TaxID=33920 RepID=A0ABU1PZ00_9PSEU|nr:tetratricopeptide repeat protein [Saccharothrix longispora]MDR6595498.1 hypothetical protein [Saccharothrix longispora]
MAEGDVSAAIGVVGGLWASGAVPHDLTLELADRFPTSEEVSALLGFAADRHVARGELVAATELGRRRVGVWRARCQEEPSPDNLDGHLGALDALAVVYLARDLPGQVVWCLAEVADWQVSHGHRIGVAWAYREMGAVALRAGDLPSAIRRLTRADEVYGEYSDDPDARCERAGCRVLLGRAARARGDDAGAREWFTAALSDLDGEAATEVHALLWAMEVGSPLPEPVAVGAGEFGRPG